MAEATIKIKDIENGEFEFAVEFYPKIENDSASHQMIAEFIKFAKLEKIA